MNFPTRDEFLALARHFFPRGLAYDDPGYFRSPEYGRYDAAWASARADERWTRLRKSLKATFPELPLGELTVPHHDAALRFAIYPDRAPQGDGFQNVVVGCVSVVIPFYFIYGARRRFKRGHHVLPYSLFIDELLEAMAPYARAAAEHVEHVYGYRPFPGEYLNTPIPDISSSSLGLGQMTLLNAFFTTGLDRIP